MARISTYTTDTDVNSSDRLLGTEYGSDLTKNYTVRSIGEHLRDRGIVTGGIQLVYSFRQNASDFSNGEFMLSTSGGNAVAMSAITSIAINKTEIGGLDTEVLLRQMLTDNIAIYGADVKNTFGEYEAGAITENNTSLVVALTAVASNGSLVDGDRYYISKIPAAIASWGNITGSVTDQTDLTAYINNNTVQNGQEVLDALNEGGLESIDLGTAESPLNVFNFSINDNAFVNSYSFPVPQTISDKYGYFLFSDTDGSLGWKQFPLDFISGFEEGAKVDGGDF